MGCTTANPPCKIEVTLQDDTALEVLVSHQYDRRNKSKNHECPLHYQPVVKRHNHAICVQQLGANRKGFVGDPCIKVGGMNGYKKVSDYYYTYLKGSIGTDGYCKDTTPQEKNIGFYDDLRDIPRILHITTNS